MYFNTCQTTAYISVAVAVCRVRIIYISMNNVICDKTVVYDKNHLYKCFGLVY